MKYVQLLPRRLGTLAVLAVGFLAIPIHAQDGLLDPSFSGDGKVVYDNVGHEEQGVDIAVRPDGKIWVIANSFDGVADDLRILLMRFNGDGTPDNSFFGDGAEELSEGTGYTFSTCAVLLADGSLLIGGYYIDDLGYTHPLVIKVDANGNPVPGFGTSGFSLGPADGYRVTDMGVQSTGTIVVTLGPLAEINPALCAVSAAGVFGIVHTQLQCSLHDKLTALQVQADDRILITGYSGTEDSGTNWRALILALNPDLTGDITFSPGYICGQLNVQTDGVEYYYSGNPLIFTNDTGNDIAVLGNGDIMVVGTTIDTTGNGDVYRTSMLKVHADNSIDASFGFEGFRKPYVGSFFRRMVVGNDNVLAVGGDYDGELVLARFSTSGVLDAGFGNNAGFTNTAVGSFSTNPSAMAVQTDGRILVVGTAVNNNDDVVVLRYNGGAVGVDEVGGANNELRAYPNPAAGNFTVVLPPNAQRITLLDAVCRVVLQRGLNGEARTAIDGVAPGGYLLVIDGPQGRTTTRLTSF